MICENCKNIFKNDWRKEKIGICRFCSKSCANSRSHSKETREKIRNGIKGKSSWNNNSWNKNALFKKDAPKIRKNIISFSETEIERKCVCGKTIKKKNKSGFCISCLKKSLKYRKEISDKTKGKCGGLRKNSVKNYKSGIYNGISFDSSWEFAYYLYCKDNNMQIYRNEKFFEYIFNGIIHKYYPDFILGDGSYVEIKGYRDETVEYKINQFPMNKKLIIIEGKKQIKPYLEYVKNKYGKDFIKLYESNRKIYEVL